MKRSNRFALLIIGLLIFLGSAASFGQSKNHIRVKVRNGGKVHVVDHKFIGDVPQSVQDEISKYKGEDGKVEEMDLRILVDKDGEPNEVSFELEVRNDKARIFGKNQKSGEQVFNLSVDDFENSVAFELNDVASLMTRFLGGNSFSFSFDGDDDEKKEESKATSSVKGQKTFVLEADEDVRSMKGFKAVSGNDGSNVIKDFSVSPNPADGEFKLVFRAKEQNDLTVEIYDEQGRQMYMERQLDFTGRYSKEMDLRSYKKGTYFLHIKLGKSLISRKILIGM